MNKKHIKQKFVIITTFIVLFASYSDFSMATGSYDTTRFFEVMAKARKGEPITIGVIGGSVTAGYAATAENKRWANLMSEWWKTTFKSSKITLINAGFGGTGSAIADFRVHDDLLKYNPDLVIIEFSVNDSLDSLSTITMEGLVRQIYASSHKPAVMMLSLVMKNGKSAIKYHQPVAEHYHLPFVNFGELIYPQLSLDKRTIDNIFKDEVHPNDTGMNYIANFIKDAFAKIYKNLPEDNDIRAIEANIPPVFISDIYSRTFKYTNSNISPATNTGWKNYGNGWSSDIIGAHMTFTFEGNAIGILYNLHNNNNWGKAEFWVDYGKHKIIDAYWTQTWGPATVFSQIAGNLPKGKHTLHIKIRSDCSNGNDGHFFPLLNILKAGK
jgi:lysophospholipase L1-like esterase